jgi:hypothetical protein
MDRGVSGSTSSVVTSKFNAVSVVTSIDISGGRSDGDRTRAAIDPGETGGGTRDGKEGGDESRSMDEAGACDRGESPPSLIIGMGLIESLFFALAGATAVGRGGKGDWRPSGRTLGSRGLGGGLLRGGTTSPFASSMTSAPSADDSSLRGV